MTGAALAQRPSTRAGLQRPRARVLLQPASNSVLVKSLSITLDCLPRRNDVKNSIMSSYGSTFQETLSAIGDRAKRLRLLRMLRQDELAGRAGVGVATVHRFEKTGCASVENVLRIATALNAEAPFEKLFEAPAYASLDEALERPDKAKRQRAPRRK